MRSSFPPSFINHLWSLTRLKMNLVNGRNQKKKKTSLFEIKDLYSHGKKNNSQFALCAVTQTLYYSQDLKRKKIKYLKVGKKGL